MVSRGMERVELVDYIPLAVGTASDWDIWFEREIIMQLLGIRWLLTRMGVEVVVVPSTRYEYVN